MIGENERVEKSMTLSNQLTVTLDTLSLLAFWRKFQENLQNDDREVVIRTMEYPIHAIFPVLFRFGHDCDSSVFARDSQKYAEFDIDSTKALEYFDFVFSKELKMAIAQTNGSMLVRKGIANQVVQGITFNLFPKEYDIPVACPNDQHLILYITYPEDEWKIEIGGL